MLNLKTGVYYGLDPMGAYIWQMLRSPVSVRELQDTPAVRGMVNTVSYLVQLV